MYIIYTIYTFIIVIIDYSDCSSDTAGLLVLEFAWFLCVAQLVPLIIFPHQVYPRWCGIMAMAWPIKNGAFLKYRYPLVN